MSYPEDYAEANDRRIRQAHMEARHGGRYRYDHDECSTKSRRRQEEDELQAQLRTNRLSLQLHRAETIRRRAIILWASALTVITLTLIAAALLGSDRLFDAAAALLIPALAGGGVHACYAEKVTELEKKV